jgi:hypothetical protein
MRSAKIRKLKPSIRKTSTNPCTTAFNMGKKQALNGYGMIFSYKTKKEAKAHYRGYAQGCYESPVQISRHHHCRTEFQGNIDGNHKFTQNSRLTVYTNQARR